MTQPAAFGARARQTIAFALFAAGLMAAPLPVWAADDCGVVGSGGTAICNGANETPAGAYGDGDGISYTVEDLTIQHSGGGTNGTQFIFSGGVDTNYGDLVIQNLTGAVVSETVAGTPGGIFGASEDGTVTISNAGSVTTSSNGVSGLVILDGLGGSSVSNTGSISVTGDLSHGILGQLNAGGLLTVTSSGTITTANGDGINAISYSDGITIVADVVVEVTGDITAVGGNGVFATTSGGGGFAPSGVSLLAAVATVSVSLDEATIDATGNGGDAGIQVFDFNSNVTVDVGSNGIITAHDNGTTGIFVFGKDVVDVTMDGAIDTTDGGGGGLFLLSVSGSVFASIDGSVTTSSVMGSGLYAAGNDDDNGNFGMVVASLGTTGTIDTTGDSAHGVHVYGDVNAFFTIAGDVLATGAMADGLHSEIRGCSSMAVTGGSTATGAQSAGIYLARPEDGGGGFAPSNTGGKSGGGAALVPSPLPTPECQAGHSADILIGAAGTVQGGWDGSTDGSSVRAAGITIIDHRFEDLPEPLLVDIENRGQLGSLSDQAVIANTPGFGVGVDLVNSGNMTGTLQLLSRGNNNTVTNSGFWGLRGWADSDGDGVRDLERIATSVLDGTADVITNQATGTIALLSTAGALIGGAGVEEAVIEGVESFRNAGLITMADLNTGLGATMPGDRLTIGGNFIGDNGMLAVDTVLNAGGSGNQSTDRLIINGNASGSTRVFVSNSGGLGEETGGEANQGISVVQVSGQASTGSFVLGAPVVAGAYEYFLNAFTPAESDATEMDERVAGNDFWDFRLQTTGKVYGGTGDYPLITLSAQQAFWTDLDVLHRRMGELRVSIADPFRYQTQPAATQGAALGVGDTQVAVRPGAGEGGPEGAWFKAYGSEFAIDAGNGFDQSLYGGIAGYDFGIENAFSQGDILLLGPTVGMAGSSVDFDSDDSDLALDIYRVGAYAVYFDGAFYVDAVTKLDLAQGTFTSPVTSTEAEFDMATAGASVEVGYTWMLDERNFFEPQAQLAYSHTWADDFEDGSGAKIALDDSDSLIGRLGFRTGTVFNTGKRGRVAPYLQAGVLHEFLGEGTATVSDLTFDASLAGTSYEVGFGAHAADLASNVSAYFDLLYRFGDDIQGVKGLIGLRVSW